jgi:Kef-type K+ transport system membrane component KefB
MFALLIAVGFEALGFHAVFGAFLVGLMLAPGSSEREPAHDMMYQFALGIFAPLYFVALGQRVDFVSDFDLTLVLMMLACIGKIGGAAIGARSVKCPPERPLQSGSQ